MSRDHRSGFYGRDRDRDRDRDLDWNRGDYRDHRSVRKRSRSRSRSNLDKRRSRTPRKSEKDIIDDNILSEISKLPEPSELWDSNQFQDSNFSAPPPPSFPTEGVPQHGPSTAYGPGYPSQFAGIYDDFNNVPSVPPPTDMAAWNQMSLPPPPQAPPAPVLNSEDQIKKEAAIESEMRQQKAALSKQREDYIKKAGILKKELDTLKDQRNELRGDAKRSPSPDTKRFLKENTKLQLEIQNKLKTITNVVDMLNGIIGEEAQLEIPDLDDSGERTSKRKSRSPAGNKFNYVYYDPEMHWCRVCNEFPPTAKDYLNHLHSPAHHKMAAAHMEAPWHSLGGMNEGFPNYPSAPTKRTPIRGLQFFVPSTAWYCKLCDQFIGDLHCASAHLKSVTHSKNYNNFVDQNPHWETDWMSDRQKAVEKSRASKKGERSEEKAAYTAHTITFHKDGFHTKHKESPARAAIDKKKKKERKRKTKRKRSSSDSSSSSTSSDSEPKRKKNRSKKKDHKEQTPDKSLSDWVSNIQMDRLNDNDRKILDSLKNRIKKDKEEDKRRSPSRASRERERDRDRERDIAELQRRLRESERRDSRPHEERRRDERREERRDERRDERREERREERHEDRREERPPPGAKKPDIKKMPFIGKMPVFKNLARGPKSDEQKKEEKKKKEDQEVSKKRQEEMDAEIQKKVAEFKQKIAKAQLERQQQLELQALVLPPPPFLPALAPPPALPTAPPQPPQPNLSKDFQDALDIIFPTGEVKNPELSGQDMFAMPPGFPLMPPFQPLGLMQPQMFGFDMNGQLFPPRPQLYDAHVPLVSSPKPRPQNKNNRQKPNEMKKVLNEQQGSAPPNGPKENSKNKEELDDLAMLGIDASDVGAGI